MDNRAGTAGFLSGARPPRWCAERRRSECRSRPAGGGAKCFRNRARQNVDCDRGRIEADQNAEALQDWARDTAVSFSPAGLLSPYHVGVSTALTECGVLHSHTPLGGASGGALVAVASALGVSASEALGACARVNAECSRVGTRANLHGILERELQRFLPENATEFLATRPAPVSIAITRLIHRTRLRPHGVLVSSFQNREHLISALVASCAIPFYFSHWPAVAFEGWPAVDGFFASPRSYFGCPTLAQDTLRVCPFPASAVSLEAPHVICPPDTTSCTPTTSNASNTNTERSTARNALGELLPLALGQPPPSDSHLEQLFSNGYHDAEVWCSSSLSTKFHYNSRSQQSRARFDESEAL